MFVQHHDVTAEVLRAARVRPSTAIDGVRFLNDAVAGREGRRDHVTIGWGLPLRLLPKTGGSTPRWTARVLCSMR